MEIEKLINILKKYKKEGVKEVYLTDVNINKLQDLESFYSFDIKHAIDGCGNYIILFYDKP